MAPKSTRRSSRIWQLGRFFASCWKLEPHVEDAILPEKEHTGAKATGARSGHPKGGACPPPAQHHAKALASPTSPSAKDHHDGKKHNHHHHHGVVPAGHQGEEELCVCSPGDSCISIVSPLQHTDRTTPLTVSPTHDARGPDTPTTHEAGSALKGRAASTSAMSLSPAHPAALPVARGISHVGFNPATATNKNTSSGAAPGQLEGQLPSLGTSIASTHISRAANPGANVGAKGGDLAGCCPPARAPMGLHMVVLTEDLADELMARELMAKAAGVARRPEQEQQRAEELPVQQQKQAELGFGFQPLLVLPPLPQMRANQQRDQQQQEGQQQQQQQGEAVVEVQAEVRQPAASLGRGYQPLAVLPPLPQMRPNRPQQQEADKPQQWQPQQAEPAAEVNEPGCQPLLLRPPLHSQALDLQQQELPLPPPPPPQQQQQPAQLQEAHELFRDPAPRHGRHGGGHSHRGNRRKPPPPLPTFDTDEQLADIMAAVVTWYTKTTAPRRPGLLNQLDDMKQVKDISPVNGSRVYSAELPAAPAAPGSGSAACGPAPSPTRVAAKVARSLWVSQRRLERWVQHGGPRARSKYCPLCGSVKRALGEMTANAAVLQRLRERPDTGLVLVPVLCFDLQRVKGCRHGDGSGSSGGSSEEEEAAAAEEVVEEGAGKDQDMVEFELVVVMAWAEGGSLTEWFDRHFKAQDPARGWDWAPCFVQLRRIGWLLRGLRRAGLVLPDLKLDNIVLLADGRLALIDVEGAVVLQLGREGQGGAVALRTDQYAAPEMFCGRLPHALAVLEQLEAAEREYGDRRRYLDLLRVQQPERLQEAYGVQLVAEVEQLRQQRKAARRELLVQSVNKGGLFLLAGWMRSLPQDVLQWGVALSEQQARELAELGVEGCRDDGFEGSEPRAYGSTHTYLAFSNVGVVLEHLEKALEELLQQRQGGGVCVGAEEGQRLSARDRGVVGELRALVGECCQVVPSRRLSPEQVVQRVEGIACRALGREVWEEEQALL